MKLSDLKPGEHIVETRGGNRYLTVKINGYDKIFIRIEARGWLDYFEYNADMTTSKINPLFDIMCVYTFKNIGGKFDALDGRYLDLVWSRNTRYVTKKEAEELLTDLHPTVKYVIKDEE